MRQRVLVILAFVVVIVAAIYTVVHFGKGDVRLGLVSIQTASWSFDCTQTTESSGKDQPPSQMRLVQSRFTFKGRTSRTSDRFESTVDAALGRVWLGGMEQKTLAPSVYFIAPRDARARPLVANFPDPYPLEALNSPLFFPFLSGRVSPSGDTWEDQFRVILSPEGAQMIVRMRTTLESIDSVRDVLIRYELKGDSIYALPSKKQEKAVLELSGSCHWDPLIALPLSQEQEMTLRTYNFAELRHTEQTDADLRYAQTSHRKSTLTLKATTRTAFNYSTPRSSASPAPVSEIDIR